MAHNNKKETVATTITTETTKTAATTKTTEIAATTTHFDCLQVLQDETSHSFKMAHKPHFVCSINQLHLIALEP